MSISLTKGQKISLAKEDGGSLSRIFMGLGWDVAKSGGNNAEGGFLKRLFSAVTAPSSIDLDASCLVFDANNNKIDEIWFGQLEGMSGAIIHTGDNLTGDGDGDDEVIKVDLSRLPDSAASLIFTVNSFRGQTFEQVENAFCRLVDDTTGKELAIYRLSESGPHTGMIMAKLYRHNATWKLHAIGEKTNGRTFHDMMPDIKATL